MHGAASSSSSGDDVSSTATRELTQANAWPTMGPTENDVAVLRLFDGVFSRLRLRLRLRELRAPNTGHGATAIFVLEITRDGGDGGDDPWHGDDVDAAAADDDDDAYGGFGFSFGAVPASGVAIACLPETTVGDGEARESGQCAVCQEEYEAGDAMRTMPCAHGFHERCIFGWLLASRLCPLCRFALPPEEEDTEADVDRGGGWTR